MRSLTDKAKQTLPVYLSFWFSISDRIKTILILYSEVMLKSLGVATTDLEIEKVSSVTREQNE